MGKYVQGPMFGKDTFLIEEYNGVVIPKPTKFSDIPDGKALIVVAQNEYFDAAGYAFDEREFEAFMVPDPRPKIYILINKEIAERVARY